VSHENVEIVRRVFERFATGQADPDLYDADVVVDTTTAAFDGAVYRGAERVREWRALEGDMWTHQRFEPQEWIVAGKAQVVVPMRIVNVGRDGIETKALGALVFTLRDGRVTHMKSFQTKADALKAVGLEA
jgi:ketosteroid isomerase-like protein